MDIKKFKNTPEGAALDPYSFCHQPWCGLGITTSSSQPGDNENHELGINFKPCCKFTVPLGMTHEEYLQSPILEKVKQQFLRGEKPEECIRCWEDEDQGLPSRRHYLTGDMPEEEFDFNESQPKWITALHSTTCNLACRICDSSSSSKWQTENRQHDCLEDDKWDKRYLHYKNQKHMDELVRLSSNLHKFTWYGGEPFIGGEEEHLAMIDQLPRRTTLEYLTNITIQPTQKILEKWSEFDDVLISLSIDGIDDYFEYNRWPAQWDVVEGNVRFYRRLAKKRNIRLRMNYAVTVLNVLHLEEFFDWNLANELPVAAITMVRYPFELNIRCLPEEAKRKVHHKLLGSKNPTLINIAKYMVSEDHSHLWEDTKKKINTVDITRGQSFAKIFPEDAKILGLINENKRNK